MRIGARLWKTALAVILALGISHLLHFKLPVFAGVAAIICMQPTVLGSLRSGLQRMQATIIGAVLSLLMLLLIHHIPGLPHYHVILIGVTVLLATLVTLYLRWMDSMVLAAATVVVIMVLPSDENVYLYAASRTIITFIGIIVATVVNAVIAPPRYTTPLWNAIQQLSVESIEIYKNSVQAFCQRQVNLAKETEKHLQDSEAALQSILTRLQWVEQDIRLPKPAYRNYRREVVPLSAAKEILMVLRNASTSIIRVTENAFSRNPKYVSATAQVYEILWELSQPSFTALEDFGKWVESTGKITGQIEISWTNTAHSQLIKAIRSAYTAPLDIFPLVEVSVVAFEIRRVTEKLEEWNAMLFK